MTIAPKEPKDLLLAPVAAAIDTNLRWLRDKTPEEIEYKLTLQLNLPLVAETPDERAAHVLDVAVRDVDLHNWDVAITDDYARLRISGGSVSLDLGFGESLTHYIAG